MTSLISKKRILKHNAKIWLQYKRKGSEKFENDTENASYAKRNEKTNFVYLFRKLKRKSCETDCVSLPFRMKRKKIQAKKGHPNQNYSWYHHQGKDGH
jgi:hypothetical protein